MEAYLPAALALIATIVGALVAWIGPRRRLPAATEAAVAALEHLEPEDRIVVSMIIAKLAAREWSAREMALRRRNQVLAVLAVFAFSSVTMLFAGAVQAHVLQPWDAVIAWLITMAIAFAVVRLRPPTHGYKSLKLPVERWGWDDEDEDEEPSVPASKGTVDSDPTEHAPGRPEGSGG